MQKRKDENLSLRGYYLRLLARWYVLPLAVIAGALLGAFVYYLLHVIYAPAREYAGGARLYLEFSGDAAGNARDYYNAWTWKELITTDDILNVAMEKLAATGAAQEKEQTGEAVRTDGSAVKKEDDELWLVPGDGSKTGEITRAEVLESVTVKLPSDLRVMMLTVTHHDPAFVEAVLPAMTDALTAFGDTNENFREIRVMETIPPLPVVTTDRTKSAVILGAVLSGLICCFFLALFYAVDDAVYDPEACAARFDLPVLGVLPAESDRRPETDARFAVQLEEEMRAACAGAFRNVRQAAVCAVSDDNQESARLAERISSVLGADFCAGACRFIPCETASPSAGEEQPDRAIVCVPAGRRGSAYAEHLIAQLKLRNIPIAGLILYDARLPYLRRLYGLSRGK